MKRRGLTNRKIFIYYPLKRGGFKPNFLVITYGSINIATTDNKEGAKSIDAFTPPIPRFSTERSSKSSDKKIGEYQVAVDTLEA